MAALTGRTVSKFVKVQIKDPTTLRDLEVDSINGIGLDYNPVEVVAWQDAVVGSLNNMPSNEIEISGPWSTTAAQAASGSAAAPTPSGSHTVLASLAGGNTPVTFAIYFGVRALWETGAPVFGLSNTVATNGYLVTAYNVDIAAGKYTAKLKPASGSACPAWGTAVLA
jgi:hypothetical protein